MQATFFWKYYGKDFEVPEMNKKSLSERDIILNKLSLKWIQTTK